MGFQCFLYSSDGGSAETIRRVLASLDMQTQSCPDAVTAAEQISKDSFQIVIVDWDNQPEAPLLLGAARERKAAERPITLAIVSDDVSVPNALQAGANSILRKPILANQVEDTLKTARDLIRSKREPGQPTANLARAANASVDGSSGISPDLNPSKKATLRAGEFLQAMPVTPGGSFETESDVHSFDHGPAQPIDLLQDLEPVAASVAEKRPVAPPAPPPPPPQTLPGEHRGLEWHLKARGVTRSAAPVVPPTPPASDKPEMLSLSQTQSYSAPAQPAPTFTSANDPEPIKIKAKTQSSHDEKHEAELFAYIEDGGSASEQGAPRSFRLGKGAIFMALLLAGSAIAAAPQAPWHPKVRTLWARGQRSLHAWLNPQPVTPPQAPPSHENFGRAGDEYKLPVAETIPDATTDPSQIQVLPVVDPTAKKAPSDAANPDQTVVPANPSGDPAADQPKAPATQVVDTQPVTTHPAPAVVPAPSNPAPVVTPTIVPVSAPRGETVPPAATPVSNPAPAKPAPPRVVTPGNIPSSLKSQMVSSTPEASGNKSPDAAMQSIEPVVVAENAERALLSEGPTISYPDGVKGQQGTVVLQVLIGRDGTVQDAKFLQGSLAFARAAIDGVKLWKFKPYTMNGRPVSVQTLMTLSFKP